MTDVSPEPAPLPRRRTQPAQDPLSAQGQQVSAHRQQPPAQGQQPGLREPLPVRGQIPAREPLPVRGQIPAAEQLPVRGQVAGDERLQLRPSVSENGNGIGLPRRTTGVRRVGRHRSLHRISVASNAPALVLAVAGAGTDADHDLAERIADAAGESCPGADIRIGYLNGTADQLADALPPEPEGGRGTAPHAIIVPLLAGPHPIFDAEIAAAISRMPVPVMLAAHLGPHPLLAGALHDRLSQVGLARASRVRGLSIQAGANGVLVVADRGPQAIGVVGVSTVLLASRLAVPAAPASLGDPVSIDAALTRLREAGVTHAAIAACVIGPETNPAEWEQLCAALGAPCTEPLGNHPAIAQLVSIRYGEALARIVAAGN